MNSLNSYYKSKNTLLEMLEDRGFNTDISIKNITINEFKDLYNKQNINFTCIHTKNSDNKIHIQYIFGENKSNLIKESIEKINKEILPNNPNSIIFIFRSKPSSGILNLLNENSCEYFFIENLQFNITKHRLVSKHSLLTNEETTELLNKYNIKSNQLPVILKSDPVIKYYNFPHGGICKIVRESRASIKTEFYRYIK